MAEEIKKRSGLTQSEFVTAVAHFYRGEMNRANVWRTRLDVTTNWAIISTAGFLSFGFGSKDIPHFVIILATVFVLFFLIIEARRYKYFDLWRWRIALVSENFFANVFSPKKQLLHENWRELLADDLQHPRFKVTFAEAFGRRLRRNYGWIFIVLAFCWITKVSIHPEPISNFSEFLQRAAVYHIIPGWMVISVGVVFNMTLFLTAILTLKERAEIIKIYPSRKSKIRITNI